MDRSEDLGRFIACAASDCLQFWLMLSVLSPLVADRPGPGTDRRSPMAWLFLLEIAFPVCWVYSAFCWAIAAAASGNIEFIVEGSSCEFLFPPAGETGALETEFREFSMFNLAIASLMRLDMGSVNMSVSMCFVPTQRLSPFSPKLAGERTPEMGWLLDI